MSNATFPVATKEYHYTINGKRYRKVTYAESQANSAGALQAAYNDGKSLGWFLPLESADSAKPKLAS